MLESNDLINFIRCETIWINFSTEDHGHVAINSKRVPPRYFKKFTEDKIAQKE